MPPYQKRNLPSHSSVVNWLDFIDNINICFVENLILQEICPLGSQIKLWHCAGNLDAMKFFLLVKLIFTNLHCHLRTAFLADKAKFFFVVCILIFIFNRICA